YRWLCTPRQQLLRARPRVLATSARLCESALLACSSSTGATSTRSLAKCTPRARRSIDSAVASASIFAHIAAGASRRDVYRRYTWCTRRFTRYLLDLASDKLASRGAIGLGEIVAASRVQRGSLHTAGQDKEPMHARPRSHYARIELRSRGPRF